MGPWQHGTVLPRALAVAAAAVVGAGCGGADVPDFGGGEASGYDVTFPAGWSEASPERFARFEEQIGAGAEQILGSQAPPIELVELWSGRVDGSPVEIDIQTEELAVSGMELSQYDELSNQNVEGIPGIEVEGTEPYIPFDGEEASVTEYTFDVPGLSTVRIATTVHDGYAYNVELAAKDAAAREAASPVLDGVIESWSWEE